MIRMRATPSSRPCDTGIAVIATAISQLFGERTRPGADPTDVNFPGGPDLNPTDVCPMSGRISDDFQEA
jgi:hypothetical protein